ncbi:MAG: glutamate 5-kinase [Bacteroidetes bacterium]|nr:MAG: glutamate 5-kinase [Bacteroidota bacterium]
MELTDIWEKIKTCKKIVVKVGTSTLSYPNGKLNFQRVEKLATVLSAIQKSGKKIILVSSGAIAVGSGRLGLKNKPTDLAEKQALAAVGQAELMKIYQKLFEAKNQMVAQVLLTKDIVTVAERKINASNTLNALMEMDVIPIINENDTVATDEIEFGDNDTLSADVASLITANLLVLLSDIDGLYSADPRIDPKATIIPVVTEINGTLEESAKGSANEFGTGGMVTKIIAARQCSQMCIPVVITNGSNPAILYELLEGKPTGTLFSWHNQEKPILEI